MATKMPQRACNTCGVVKPRLMRFNMSKSTKSPPPVRTAPPPQYPADLAVDASGEAGLTFVGFVTDGSIDAWGERIVATIMTAHRMYEAAHAFKEIPNADNVNVSRALATIDELICELRDILHDRIVSLGLDRQEKIGGAV
jgi:hypothetical protein